MGLKRDELARADSCLNRAADDEPLFVLRAQDRFAAFLVEQWADMASRIADTPHDKVIEALQIARDMRAWRGPHKLPD